MSDSAAQTKEEALDVLLLAVRRFLYPRPTPDAAELQVSRSIDKLVKAFHAWEVAEPLCQHQWVGRKTAGAAEWWECSSCGAVFRRTRTTGGSALTKGGR